MFLIFQYWRHKNDLFQIVEIFSILSCADPGIFVRGGPGQSDKKALTTLFFCFVF